MSDPTVVRHADRVLRVAQGMAADGPAALNESIGDSWRRCVRDYSLDPVRVYSPAVISTGDVLPGITAAVITTSLSATTRVRSSRCRA